MSSFVVLVCSFVVCVVCATLVLHKDYEDGLLGRIALVMLAIGALVRIMGIVDAWADGTQAPKFSPVALVVWIGLALFFARHIYRFFRWKHAEASEWRKPDRVVTGGK